MNFSDFVMNNGFWIGVYPGINKEKLDYIDYLSLCEDTNNNILINIKMSSSEKIDFF